MKIIENITREKFSERGGGCELDLTEFGYEDELMSAYQNYLGGGLRGSVANSCTIEDWQLDDPAGLTAFDHPLGYRYAPSLTDTTGSRIIVSLVARRA